MASGSERPDPDALLLRVQAEEARASRAKLKVFFGFAPGVGKTYAMLESAQRAKTEGVDVVVGCVETHGRKETERLVEGLEVLPRRAVLYRETQLMELDLDAAIARKPAILLLDELAHTNAPGSRHRKRFQDVLELLDAGIEVHTTLNVQHVESLNDVIAQVTGVVVRETVPDALLDRADEIELVDLPPEDLLERLAEGKVYLADQAVRAAQNFFQRGNLLALRELALRKTAERVDADVQAYRAEHDIVKTWAAQERVLVCVGPAPASASLVRAAGRIASRLHVPWVAAYVQPPGLAVTTDADRERLEANLRLAESLGATVARMSGERVSEAVLDYARRHDVTRIIIGKPTHSRFRDFVFGSVLDQIVRGSGAIDVQVISGADGEGDDIVVRPARPRVVIDFVGCMWAVGLVVVMTCIGWWLRAEVSPVDMAMLYLLVIVSVAARFGRASAFVASAASVASYDFFFVAPYLTFDVGDVRHLVTFVTMFVVGLLISGLTVRVRRQEQEAIAREAHTASLYALSRALGDATNEDAVAAIVARHVANVFSCGVSVFLAGADDFRPSASRGVIENGPQEHAVARWALEHRRMAGWGTDTLPGANVVAMSFDAGGKAVGVLALARQEARGLTTDQRSLLQSIADLAGIALERARLAEVARTAALRARTEEMRSSILSAVSHDLRTPLGAITGAASTLREGPSDMLEEQRLELLDTLYEEAERLERLVGNLLDLTRLESGALRVRREWIPFEEIVGSALTRLEARLGDREVRVHIPDKFPLLSVDPVLFEQVFINLLENAIKHTPSATPVEISAKLSGETMKIDVADKGPGFRSGEETRVFDKFFRSAAEGVPGVGLGLAVCKGVVEVHGGTIEAANRPEGGARFTVTLPLPVDPPSSTGDAIPEAP